VENKLFVLKEKMQTLVEVPRFGIRRARPISRLGENVVADGQDVNEEETEDDFSDIEDFSEGDGSDVELLGDEEDGWSDEDECEDEDGIINFDVGKMRDMEKLTSDSKDRVPVFPDGRPREQW
jgi:hypothetical protein